ncbi:Vacuolar protein-sorting-associated protein 25 [Tritrichomonas musculus]|uniref:Vacuolar protein-sorting-associated protein 25 n=1 Tax=Tritrichomonas musculus TaxID=1915356 RepID=A0ABR2K4B7_9EUKA
MSKYKFPPIHDFPPFYTFQEDSHEASRIQVSAWTDIIMKYKKSQKKDTLDLDKELDSDLFNNKAIKRKMSMDDAIKIVSIMVDSQNAEYIDPSNKKKVKLITRKPGEWAEIIFRWATEKSLRNTVITFYEIAEGDDSADQPFYKIDYKELYEAAKVLEKNKRAKIMKSSEIQSSGKEDYVQYGLKIL